MSEKRDGEIILKEAPFATPKKINQSSKRISDEVLDRIKNDGVTIEQIEQLGVPIYRYKTQITLHGVFDTDKIDGYAATGYKSMIVNKNLTLGVRYVAVDAAKKRTLDLAVNSVIIEIANKTSKGWRIFYNSTGWIVQKQFDTEKEARFDVRDFPVELVGGSLYLFKGYSLSGKSFFVAQSTISFIYETDLDKVISYFSPFNSAQEVEKANELFEKNRKKRLDKWEEEYEKENQEEEQEIAAMREKVLGILQKMGFDPDKYDRLNEANNFINSLFANIDNQAKRQISYAAIKKELWFNIPVLLKDLNISKPFRLLTAKWEYPDETFGGKEVYIQEWYITKDNYRVRHIQIDSSNPVLATSLDFGGKYDYTAESLAFSLPQPRANLVSSLKSWVNFSNNHYSVFYVLPDFTSDKTTNESETDYTNSETKFSKILQKLGLKEADGVREIEPNSLKINEPMRLVVYFDRLGYDEPVSYQGLYEWHLLKTRDTNGEIVYKEKSFTLNDYSHELHNFSLGELENAHPKKDKNPIAYNNKMGKITYGGYNHYKYWVVPFAKTKTTQQPTKEGAKGYANSKERFLELSVQEGKNVLIPSSSVYVQMAEIAKSLGGVYQKDPKRFEFPTDNDAATFLAGQKGIITSNKIDNYDEAVLSLTQENQYIKHPAFESGVWAQINGQVKSSGGWYDKFIKGFRFKSEQAAINFLKIIKPQQAENSVQEQEYGNTEPTEQDVAFMVLKIKLSDIYKRAQNRKAQILNFHKQYAK